MRSLEEIVRQNADRPRVITDKERLDWLDKHLHREDLGFQVWTVASTSEQTVREAIDRAIREAESLTP